MIARKMKFTLKNRNKDFSRLHSSKSISNLILEDDNTAQSQENKDVEPELNDDLVKSLLKQCDLQEVRKLSKEKSSDVSKVIKALMFYYVSQYGIDSYNKVYDYLNQHFTKDTLNNLLNNLDEEPAKNDSQEKEQKLLDPEYIDPKSGHIINDQPLQQTSAASTEDNPSSKIESYNESEELFFKENRIQL